MMFNYQKAKSMKGMIVYKIKCTPLLYVRLSLPPIKGTFNSGDDFILKETTLFVKQRPQEPPKHPLPQTLSIFTHRQSHPEVTSSLELPICIPSLPVPICKPIC